METSLTLLQSIKQQGDFESWELLDSIYSPMIRRWLKRSHVRPADEADVLQEVLLTVSRKIPSFERGVNRGSFRSWLKKITVNCLRNYTRKRGNRGEAVGGSEMALLLQQLEDPDSLLSQAWNEEHQRCVFQHLMAIVRPGFKGETWKAFYDTAVSGKSAREVADDIGMTVGAVHTAKSRVLSELRRIGQGLLED